MPFIGAAVQGVWVLEHSSDWLTYYISDCIIFPNRYILVPAIYGVQYIESESLDAVRAVAVTAAAVLCNVSLPCCRADS